MEPPKQSSSYTGLLYLSKLELALIILLIGLTTAHFLTLTTFPPPHVDDIWALARAFGMTQTGWPFGPLDEGVFDQLDGHKHFFPFLPTAFHALSIVVTNQVSLFEVRIVSLLFGLILLLSFYRISKTLVSRSGAILVLCAISLSPAYLLSSHLGRSDIQAAAFGYFALSLVLTNYKRSAVIFLIAGLLATLALEIHAYAAPIWIVCATAIFLSSTGARLCLSAVMWFALGSILGVLFYLSLHVLPSPSAFLEFKTIAFAPSHLPPLLTGDPVILFHSIRKGFQVVLFDSFIVFVFVFFIALGTWIFASCSVRSLALLALIGVVSFGLLVPHKMSHYAIYAQPLVVTFLVILGADLWRQRTSRSGHSRVGALGTMVISIGIVLAWSITPLKFMQWQAPKREFEEVIESIHAAIEPDDTILGAQTFWLAAKSNRYYAWEHLVYFTRWNPEASVRDALTSFSPTIIIEDNQLRNFLASAGAPCTYICLPDHGLNQWIDDSDTVLSLNSESFGKIRLLRPATLAPLHANKE